MMHIVFVKVFSLVAVIIDGCLISFVCIVRRVVIMTIDDVLARLAHAKIPRLSKELA